MLRTMWVLGFLFSFASVVNGQSAAPKALHVRGVEVHYVEQGNGEPLILLHGGQGDYRAWAPQMAALSQQFRVISYSRRYHYPNHNPLTGTNHSAYVEAEDLAAVIKTLRLGRVHLVGTSIGAATALVLALQRPEMVRSLVLAEPPIHGWIRDSAATASIYQDFIATVQEPAARAFRNGDDTDPRQGVTKISRPPGPPGSHDRTTQVIYDPSDPSGRAVRHRRSVHTDGRPSDSSRAFATSAPEARSGRRSPTIAISERRDLR